MSRAMAHSKCIITEAAPTDLALLVQVRLVKVEISATIARFNERRFVSPPWLGLGNSTASFTYICIKNEGGQKLF